MTSGERTTERTLANRTWRSARRDMTATAAEAISKVSLSIIGCRLYDPRLEIKADFETGCVITTRSWRSSAAAHLPSSCQQRSYDGRGRPASMSD